MKEVLSALTLLVLALGVTYLVSAGIAWVFIWAFNLSYSPWIVAFPVWIIWKVIDNLIPKREKTLAEKWRDL